MINNMVMALNIGLMEASTKECTTTQRNMASVNTHGPMVTDTLEIGKIMPFMEMVSTFGQMAESIQVNG